MKRLECQLMQDLHTSSSSAVPTSEKDDKSRSLPDLPIPGDIVYFLDDLLETAARELGRDPKEVMADVVSRGLASFVASIPKPDQKRLGLDPARFQVASSQSEPGSAGAPAIGDDSLADLEKVKRRLENQLQEERHKSRRLAESIRELKLELEDQQIDLQPQSLSDGAYETTYTELTHHAFSETKAGTPAPQGKRSHPASKNKSNKRKRRKGSPPWNKESSRSRR